MAESYFAKHSGGLKQVYGQETYRPMGPSDPEGPFRIPSLQYPSQDTVRLRLAHPEQVLRYRVPVPCETFTENWKFQGVNVPDTFNVANQKGYKTRDYKDGSLNNLRGTPANNWTNEALGLASRYGDVSGNAPFKIEDSHVNNAKTQYYYGLQDQSPSMGFGLAGSDPVLLKGHRDPYQLIYSTKRAGAMLSGRYSGHQAADSAQNDKISNGVDF